MHKKIAFLETLRGFAALYVVIHHARWLLWEGYSNGYLKNLSQFGAVEKMLVYFMSIFSFGHEMVLFFFVLSGFVIHLNYAKRLASGNHEFQVKKYLFRRLKRIYPPLIFALVFTFLIDSVGKYYGFPIYGANTSFAIVQNNFTSIALYQNFFLVMDSYTGGWGSDFPLWSLKLEWWFYLLYPLFFLILRRSSLTAFIIVTLLYCLSFFSFLWPIKLIQEVFTLMIVWWLGVVLADIYTKRITVSFRYLSFLCFLLPFSILNPLHLDRAVTDIFWGLSFVGLLSLLFCLKESSKILSMFNGLSWMGSFSFSLYITHAPILVFISGYLLKKNKALPLHFEYAFLGIFLCVLFAYLIHWVIEIPFITKAKKIQMAAIS